MALSVVQWGRRNSNGRRGVVTTRRPDTMEVPTVPSQLTIPRVCRQCGAPLHGKQRAYCSRACGQADHYGRWKEPHPARFWSKVDQRGPDECWDWQAALNHHGYGVYRFGGRNHLAHRMAYELIVGPIPPGKQLDHVRARGCHGRACCNPAHLEPITHRENQLRGDGPGGLNARKTHCAHGHPFTPENTYIDPSTGGRRCRTCARLWKRRDARRRHGAGEAA